MHLDINIDNDKYECVFANDYDSNSEKIYKLNHSTVNFKLEDLNKIKIDDIPDHDILCGGFPCFIIGTQTLTDNGYKNIEDVRLTDKLLTHSGNFQNILNLQKKIYSGYLYDIKIKYHHEIISSTEEHPYYVREKKKIWNNSNREYTILYSEPKWKNANELTMNDYFGMIINQNKIIPEFTFEKVINQQKTEKVYIKLDNLDYWFVMGYLIDNNYIDETKNKDGINMYKINFSINNKDGLENEIFERINKVIPIIYKNSYTENEFKEFSFSNFIWYNILKEFRINIYEKDIHEKDIHEKDIYEKDIHEKLIPEWIQDAPKEFIQEFINGYMKSKNNVNKILQFTTVSLNLALGFQRLYSKLGRIFSINKCIHTNTCTIKDRLINKKYTYFIREVLEKEQNSKSFIDGKYIWYAPFKITKKKIIDIPVYNFEVENDNSYIVENTIVHNCQPFSIAGEKKGFDDVRSNVFWKLCEIIKNKNPEILILENVKNLKSHDDGNTYQIIEDNLKTLGYHIKSSILDTSQITNIPQHRERIYIICFKDKSKYDKFNFKFNIVENKEIKLFLEESIHNKYYYTDKLKVYNEVKKEVKKHINENILYQYRRFYVRENKSNCCPTLTANMGSGGHNVPLLLDDKGIRKLTPRECFNLQGFPSNYKLPNISDSALYKLAGNGVTVPVIELIVKKLNDII
jgi:DNA (cytosine-5)-methyltransferase 1